MHDAMLCSLFVCCFYRKGPALNIHALVWLRYSLIWYLWKSNFPSKTSLVILERRNTYIVLCFFEITVLTEDLRRLRNQAMCVAFITLKERLIGSFLFEWYKMSYSYFVLMHHFPCWIEWNIDLPITKQAVETLNCIWNSFTTNQHITFT